MTAEYINAHESIYNYLLFYFRQDAAHEIEQDERMTCCRMNRTIIRY